MVWVSGHVFVDVTQRIQTDYAAEGPRTPAGAPRTVLLTSSCLLQRRVVVVPLANVPDVADASHLTALDVRLLVPVERDVSSLFDEFFVDLRPRLGASFGAGDVFRRRHRRVDFRHI